MGDRKSQGPSLVTSMKEYIERMVGLSGMKALIMDDDTTKMLGLVFSLTQALAQKIYLVDRLSPPSEDSKNDDSATTQHLKAIVFLRPTPRSIDILCQNLACPKYREYHLFFSNVLSDEALKSLAGADEHGVVTQVQEYYADFFALDQNVFSLNLGRTVQLHNNSRHNWSSGQRQIFDRMVDGVLSVLLANKTKPVIRHSSRSELCRNLATTINTRMRDDPDLYHQRSNCLLLLVDRRDDPVTPLLSQWTYQAMLHELLGIKGNRIDMRSITDISPELREVVLAAHDDKFFQEAMYLNFGDLGIRVKKLVSDWQLKSNSTKQDMKSIEDMQKFVDNYPQFKQEAGNVSKHVSVISELSRQVSAHCLLQVSEVEQELACNQDHSEHLALLLELMDNAKVPFRNKLRLILLYALRYEGQRNQLEQFVRVLRDRAQTQSDQKSVQAVSALLSYAGNSQRTGDLFEKKQSFFDKANKFLSSGLQGVENIYTQHKPAIARILDDVMKGTLKTADYPCVGSRRNFDTVVVFMVGGATYEEAHLIHTLNAASRDMRFILGGTAMHNSASFLADVLQTPADSSEHSITIRER